MRIADLEFKDENLPLQTVLGGFRAIAYANAFAAGNKYNFVYTGTYTFQSSGSYGR